MATLVDNSGNTTGVAKFGGATSGGIRSRTASKFTSGTGWTATDITVRINEDTGNPTGDVQIGIFTDSSGVPSSTQVGGWATVAAGDITGSYTDFSRSFSSSAVLADSTVYWVVLKVASGESDANYYGSRATNGFAVANGAQYNEPTPATWTNNQDNLYYVLSGTIAGLANVKTWDGLATASIKTFNGLATASVKSVNGLQ